MHTVPEPVERVVDEVTAAEEMDDEIPPFDRDEDVTERKKAAAVSIPAPKPQKAARKGRK